MSGDRTPLPPDQAARDRIRTDLDTNLLVEAGAGSGKTTSLVERLVALVERGAPLESIAAVTFTRKAAAELRERFQLRLEAAGHLDALRDLDRAFLGTIHAFAGRLLREHPLEAGLDPAFEEVDQEGWPLLCEAFWERWLEQLRLAGDADLRTLDTLGLDPRALLTSFKTIVGYPDVEFPTVESPRPDHAPVQRRLEELLGWAGGLMPAQEPEAGYDGLQEKVRLLRFLQATTDWSDTRAFCEAVEQCTGGKLVLTYNRWVAGRKKDDLAPIKELEAAWREFLEGPATALLERWREHRYPAVVRFLRRGAQEFAAERRRHGTLGFEDLLVGAVRLLRDRPEVRRRLGERWRRLLVDEFQDTDPIQAELCFLLASPPEEGTDWRAVRPRPGALFVVGDPKQSIYRFRRADIQTYEQVRERMATVGGVVQLPASFRTRPAVAELVNAHFRTVFPTQASETQAAFSPLQPQRAPEAGDGIFRYTVTPDKESVDAILAADAAAVAAWVATEIGAGRAAEDFLVLTRQRRGVAQVARALSQWQVPVDTTGAELKQDTELRELLLLLRALSDPSDPVRVTAALEGLFFGCTPADLWEARRAGVRFTLLDAPAESGPEPVRGALGQLVRWRRLADTAPADVLLERILDDTGLLALAASEPLGEGRAGVLLHLVEQLRGGDGGAALDLVAALERVEAALDAEGLDVPLRPGRGGAVRVMNLHQAKGLEAHTVILAAPLLPTAHDPTFHVSRQGGGTAEAWCALGDGDRIVAQPPAWARFAAREEEFRSAEEARLLYVASTRAAQRLVIGRARLTPKADGGARAREGSPWAALDAVTANTPQLVIPSAEPPGRPRLAEELSALVARAEAAAQRVASLAAATVSIRTVTERVKVEPPTESWRAAREEERAYDVADGRPRGAAWGRVVHRALEGMGRGRRDEALARYVRAVVADELPWESAEAQESRVEEALALCARVLASPEWASLGPELQVELPVYRLTREDGRAVIEEGVIDAVGRAGDGWRVVDWKTDAAHWAARVPQYQAQVEAYAAALQALTGLPATGQLARLVE